MLPLSGALTNLFLGVLLLVWGAGGYCFKNHKKIQYPLPLLFLGLYLLYILGMAWSENSSFGLSDLETKLTLFFLPLILFTGPLISDKIYRKIFYAFLLGCLLGSLWCIGGAFFTWIETGANHFFYERLADYLDRHPAYLSLYFGLAICFILVEFFNSKKSEIYRRIQWLSLAGWFFIFVLLLSARMGLIALLTVLLIGYFIYTIKNKTWKQFGVVMVAGGILAVGFLNLFPYTKMRLQAAVEEAFQQNGRTTNVRSEIWDAARTVIKSNPFGVGTGDSKDALLEIYKEKNYIRPLEANQNAHNQYLQTTVALGIPGGLLLLAGLIFPFLLAWKHEEPVYLFFLGLIMMAFLTESMLERQQGVLFYAFFNSLLAMNLCFNYNKKITE